MNCHLCGAAIVGHSSAEMNPWVSCVACEATVFRPRPGPKIVVAHDTSEILIRMGTILHEADLNVLAAHDGEQVLELLGSHTPAAVVLDVGLGKVLTFQLLETLKKDPALADTRAILVASVFRNTAYKRRPHSLYGADDYIEQHHIPDALLSKVAKLIGFDAEAAQRHVQERRAAIEAASERTGLAGAVRLRALAHSIVADIALYHQSDVERALKGEPTHLQDALEEGRRVLAEWVDPETYADRDPIAEAFEVFMAEMRRVTQ